MANNKGSTRLVKAHLEAAIKEMEDMTHEEKSKELDILLSGVMLDSLKIALYSTAYVDKTFYNVFLGGNEDYATTVCKLIEKIDTLRKEYAA